MLPHAGGHQPSIGVGAICGVLYLLHARRKADPIIDLRLAADPHLRGLDLGRRLFFMGTVSSIFLLALLLQLGFGLSAFQAGLMTLASAVGSLLMRFTFRPILRQCSASADC